MKIFRLYNKVRIIGINISLNKALFKVKKILKSKDNAIINNEQCLNNYIISEILFYNYKWINYNGYINNEFIKIHVRNIINHKIIIFNNTYTDVNKKINRNTEKNSIKNNIIKNMISKDYNSIDWNCDFHSGYRWDENKRSEDLRYFGIEGVDVKVPWELGRMQHLPFLAYAVTVLSKDNFEDEFIQVINEEIKNQMLDFIFNNLLQRGIQWKTSMDSAIRMTNWLVTLDILHNNGFRMYEEAERIIYNHISDTARYIYQNPEWSEGMRGNHYLACISGLLVAAAHFPVNEETTKWLIFAINELIAETFRQFQDDGSNFEASTLYHCLSSEIIFISLYIIKHLPIQKVKEINKLISIKKIDITLNNKNYLNNIIITNNKIDFSEELFERINNINKFILDIRYSDNSIPQIGDNDSGYYININSNENDEKRIYVHDIYNEIIKDRKGKKINQIITEEIVKYNNIGIYIYNKEKYKLIIRCGQVGQNGKGGHSHNDCLAFTLGGNSTGEIFVDPGTYCYTSYPEMRNKYRSVHSHNTLCIKGVEQNKFPEGGGDSLFWIEKDRTKARVLECNENVFHGCHKAYKAICERKIFFEADRIVFNDKCLVKMAVYMPLHMHPKVIINKTNDKNRFEIIKDDSIINLTFPLGKCEIQDYEYSSSYLSKEPAKRVIFYPSKNEFTWEIKIL